MIRNVGKPTARRLGVVGFESAHLRAQHIREDVERTAAVRERSTLPPARDEAGPLVELPVELPDKPALPHPRSADQRHELQGPLAPKALYNGKLKPELVAPVLPYLTDSADHLDALLGQIAAAGASGVTVFGLHLRSATRGWV